MAKLKSISEAETARRRAVTGLRNLGRDEDADRIDSLSAREYADERGFEIIENPHRRRIMARRTKSREELEAEIEELRGANAELEETVDELQGQIDDISEILGVVISQNAAVDRTEIRRRVNSRAIRFGGRFVISKRENTSEIILNVDTVLH